MPISAKPLWFPKIRSLDQAFGLPEVLVAVSTSRQWKRAGKTRTLMPVWDSSGEFSLSISSDHQVASEAT